MMTKPGLAPGFFISALLDFPARNRTPISSKCFILCALRQWRSLVPIAGSMASRGRAWTRECAPTFSD